MCTTCISIHAPLRTGRQMGRGVVWARICGRDAKLKIQTYGVLVCCERAFFTLALRGNCGFLRYSSLLFGSIIVDSENWAVDPPPLYVSLSL